MAKLVGQGGGMENPVIDRFVIRPSATGHRVVDVWTGETAMIAMTAQDEMSEDDARHIAQMLNDRAKQDESAAHRGRRQLKLNR